VAKNDFVLTEEPKPGPRVRGIDAVTLADGLGKVCVRNDVYNELLAKYVTGANQCIGADEARRRASMIGGMGEPDIAEALIKAAAIVDQINGIVNLAAGKQLDSGMKNLVKERKWLNG